MKTPTYKEQFDKLTAAYIGGEVNPFHACQCFVGNLLQCTTENLLEPNHHDYDWVAARHGIGMPARENTPSYLIAQNFINEHGGFYTPQEIVVLENIFMQPVIKYSSAHYSFRHGQRRDYKEVINYLSSIKGYEEDLFKGFEAALDYLKEIHRQRGEDIDNSLIFTKRTIKNETANLQGTI